MRSDRYKLPKFHLKIKTFSSAGLYFRIIFWHPLKVTVCHNKKPSCEVLYLKQDGQASKGIAPFQISKPNYFQTFGATVATDGEANPL